MNTHMNTRKLALLSITLVAALAAAGCGGGSNGKTQGYMTSAPPPPPVGEAFTSWSKSTVFPQSENTPPVVMDTLVFRFDGDDDPNAYADLLPAT